MIPKLVHLSDCRRNNTVIHLRDADVQVSNVGLWLDFIIAFTMGLQIEVKKMEKPFLDLSASFQII